jgi:aspartate racemase
MLASAQILAGAGADILICPDNTIHQAFELVLPESPLPWLHIAEVTAAEAARRGVRTAAILGTRWLVESDVYPTKLDAFGIGHVLPEPSERAELQRVIMRELVEGRFLAESVAWLQDLVGQLRERGADAVILGCTELPLVLSDDEAALPTLDTTRLLARAALHHSVSR